MLNSYRRLESAEIDEAKTMESLGFTCVGWFSECSAVYWTALGTMGTVLAAAFSLGAVWMALEALKNTRDLDKAAAARTDAREKRDAIALAAVIYHELKLAQTTLDFAFSGELNTNARKLLHLREERNALATPFTKSALPSLGCFAEPIAAAIGMAVVGIRYVYQGIPEQIVPPNRVDLAVEHVENQYNIAKRDIETATTALSAYAESRSL